MKKFIVSIVLFIGFSLSLFSSFSFEAFNFQDPIYNISRADKNATSTSLHVAYFFDDYPRFHMKYDGSLIEFKNGSGANNLYGKVRAGGALSILNFSYEPIFTIGLDMHYSLHTMFKTFDKTDLISFDGIFFFGPAINLYDYVTIKFGIQHYSGHFADEALFTKLGSPINENELAAFVFDASLITGVSFNYKEYARLYLDVVAESLNGNYQPQFFKPKDNFNNIIINTGLELAYPINKSIGVFVATDLKFSEYGKVIQYNDSTQKYDIGYIEDNPWKFEYTIGGGIELYDKNLGLGALRIEAFYNYGSSPALNQFFSEFGYLTAGITIAP